MANLATLPIGSLSNVIVVLAHGLGSDDIANNRDFLAESLPNLKDVQRRGLFIERCSAGTNQGEAVKVATDTAQDVGTMLRMLLLPQSSHRNSLGGQSGAAGRRSLQVLPWRPLQSTLNIGDAKFPHWSIVEGKLQLTSPDWVDLQDAEPTFVASDADDETEAYFQNQIIGRFPGKATMNRPGTAPASSWMHWIADGFLRSLWYATARSPGGTFALLAHPVMHVYKQAEGYDAERGLSLLDDLAGRLLALSDHPALGETAVVISGDGDENDWPVFAIWPGLDRNITFERAAADDVAALLFRFAATS